MSEVPSGAGWWMASDGKWYPPELHPDATPPAPVAGAAPSEYPMSGGGQLSQVQQSAGMGVGASAGGLPPLGGLAPLGGTGAQVAGPVGAGPTAPSGSGSPQAHAQPYAQPGVPGQPVYVQAGTPVQPDAQFGYGQPGYAQPGYAQPGYGQAFDYQGFGVPGGGPAAEGRRSKRRRPLVIALGAVAVVIAVVAGLFGFGVVSLASSWIPLGSGTATITWPQGSNSSTGLPPPSTFSGTVSGMTVTGTGQFSPDFVKFALGQTGTLPAKVPVFVIHGAMKDKVFSVTVSMPKSEIEKLAQVSNPGSSGGPSTLTVTYDVDGSYGTETISGTLTQTGDSNSNETPPMMMNVAIGSLRVSGTIHMPNASNRATATYSIS